MPKFTVEVELDLDEYLSDPDAVRADVRNSIISDIARSCRVDWLVDDASRAAMRESVNKQITDIVSEVVTAEVRSIADGQFIPTNKWGERRGEPTTLREMCAEQARHWFSEAVDANGKTDTYSNTKRPRIQWMIASTIDEVFKAECKSIVDGVKAEVRAGLQARVQSEIATAVAGLLAPQVTK